MKEHNSSEESRVAFLEQFEEGSKTGYWMGVVWELKPNDQYVVRMTTRNFPKGKYTDALLTLKGVLDKEIELELSRSVPETEPLPLASHLLATDRGVQESQMKDSEDVEFPSVSFEPESNNEPIEEEKRDDEENS